MKQLDFDNPKYEWLVYRDTDFSVEIKSWGDLDKHHWNVYAYIFDTHRLFNHFDAVYDLHFHGGITYEQLIRHTPAQEIKYEWQKEYTYLKVGSDYSHLYDDWFATQNPANGIPFEIKSDASKLVEELKKASEK
jgi:deoxyadenosine/deoxycytidine kinase